MRITAHWKPATCILKCNDIQHIFKWYTLFRTITKPAWTWQNQHCGHASRDYPTHPNDLLSMIRVVTKKVDTGTVWDSSYTIEHSGYSGQAWRTYVQVWPLFNELSPYLPYMSLKKLSSIWRRSWTSVDFMLHSIVHYSKHAMQYQIMTINKLYEKIYI